jgi:hypothetical protein
VVFPEGFLMAKDCNCSGARCGCKVAAGVGVLVAGTGTAVDPFIISRDSGSDSVTGMVVVNDSTTVKLTRLGSGTVADPYVLKASIVIASPNGSLWTLAVSDAGVVSAVAL